MNLNLTNYDFIFFIIIGASSALALLRGGVSEVISLCTWFIVYYIITHYSVQLNKFIPHAISNHLLRTGIIFIGVFIIVAIIMTIIKNLTNSMVSSIGFNSINYILGLIFGAVRGLLLCALLIIIVEVFNIDTSQNWKQAKLAPLITPVVHGIAHIIPEQLKNV